MNNRCEQNRVQNERFNTEFIKDTNMKESMKKGLLITIMMISFAFTINAQETDEESDKRIVTEPMTASFCMSFSDYKNNNWIVIENVVRRTRSMSAKIWSGGGDYVFEAESDEQTRLLKKKAFAVMYNDTVYISLRGLRHGGARFGGGYDKAIKCKDGSLLFAEKYISRITNYMQLRGIDFSAIDRASEESQLQNRVWYIVSSDERKIECIDDKYAKRLLAGRKELLDEYSHFNKKQDSSGGEEKYNAARMLPFLKKIGILE